MVCFVPRNKKALDTYNETQGGNEPVSKVTVRVETRRKNPLEPRYLNGPCVAGDDLRGGTTHSKLTHGTG